MALLNFNTKVGTIFSSLSNMFEMSRGINIQEKAAKSIGSGFRQQSAANIGLAEYNIELDRQDLNNNLDAMSRDISRLMSTQRSQMASKGISSTSKSYLALQNEALNRSIQQVIGARNNQQILATQRRYQAAAQAVDLENQARISEYNAKVGIYQSRQKQSSFLPSLLNQIGSLF